ncbi:peptide chain release factor N(5)-glutamine methyltransferase [Methylobacterium sp. J-090]|uniref:peptide chain release factor N(5)-glutamine methyltransferase n=1 Tax=Methylobacterium sp. J-090 TaxID=2836666 RepID=UPI001FB8F5FB|nr:peptide chain release factor N(5)-glutamine methyltransferase [Methylobacterium sp. J-090]MCJ2083069.1 peptide chain release factor N(5)-glutamine methyltransferase [Methylobacterium sp. J-090]
MALIAATPRAEALRHVTRCLAEGGIGDNDARFLVLDILRLTGTELILGGSEPIGPSGAASLSEALNRRLAGEPVARIVGAWEFWGLSFGLAPDTLVPRADTETLVEAALARHPDRSSPLRILDLGTGSGCILVALLSERPRAYGIGLDRSAGALVQARRNAKANGVGDRAAFVRADWSAGLTGAFDLIVSNPPYIPAAIIATLADEVRLHDPAAALDGGADGLDAYRRILAEVAEGPVRLAAGGSLVFEVGHDQAAAVRALGREVGLAEGGTTHDLAGHARVVAFIEA